MTMIVGSPGVSFQPKLSSMVRIAINFQARRVGLFCRRPKLGPLESEGDHMVAATRAAITPCSSSDFLDNLPDPTPRFLSSSPLESSQTKNESLKSCDVSNEGDWTAEAATESDLRPTEVVSSAPTPTFLVSRAHGSWVSRRTDSGLELLPKFYLSEGSC